MRRTLYLKFLLAYAIFGLFGFLCVAFFASNMILEYITRDKANTLYQEAILIAEAYAKDLYDNKVTRESVQKQLDVLDTYLMANIWVVTPSGRILIDSSKDIPTDSKIIINDFDPTSMKNSYYSIGRFYNHYEEDVLSVFASITSNFKVRAYVFIHYPMSELYKSQNSLLNITYIIFILLLLLSLIILLFFTELVYKPLKHITAATEQYASGNMHYEFAVDSEDEMGYLAATLSYMANKIALSEDNQKKFVANISHDFRSPLTSIKGYLEAMLDGTIPKNEYDRYISLVLNETDRLTKLTNSLLTLNNLNTGGMILDNTDFDLNQVIRDTVASFEGTCMKKQLGIALSLTGDEMYVYCDISKIQQVLYNLLDNAIKFSHNESVIRIETTEKKGKIFVSIKDQGIGIPKESISLIWDRFYKTDLSRGKDKKGTGLGLAITKEILHSHNEHINVISTEGVGTEFIFSLPLSDINQE